MKKTITQTAFLIIFSFLFFACRQDESIQKNNATILTDNEIHNLGVEHNNALSSVLTGLKNRKNSQDLDEKSFLTILNVELSSYYKTLYSSKTDMLQSANQYSQTEVSKYLQVTKDRTFLRADTDLTPIESVIAKHKATLSNDQISLLIQCDKALESASDDIDGTINELNRIQNSARKILSKEEAQVILIGAEIGKSSINYWNENFNDWKALIAPTNQQARTALKFSWGEVAGADVAGGVGGAVGALAVNLIPGAGQVAYGGAIIGGAAGASAADAVYQVWNNFF